MSHLPHEEKPTVRALLKQRIEGIDMQTRRLKSENACQRVIETEEFKSAVVVMAYLSTADEIDTTMIIKEAWKLRKIVLAPKIIWRARVMIPVRIFSLDEGLVSAKLGIREPESDEPYLEDKIDLTIVPALGFSEEGDRIGHGMGFYDRFLSQAGYQGVSCGLGFEEQVLKSLPKHEHDVPLDLVVTDEKVRRFERKRRG